MFNWRKKLISIMIIVSLLITLCLLGASGNGQVSNNKIFESGNVYEQENEETRSEEVEKAEADTVEQKVTNLNIILLDNINGSRINLQNCVLRLVGEMQIAEDMYTYDNFFVDGDIYKITVLIELKEENSNEGSDQ